MKKPFQIACLGIGLLLSHNSFAAALQFGITLPFLIKTKDPENVHGYRAVVWYQPPAWMWKHWNIYLAAGAGHWWVPGASMHQSLNIFALAPVIRYYFAKTPRFSPYFEASIGVSYLSKTRFVDRNLGEHFSFQDEVGIGTAYGDHQQWYASLSALHYSNGSLSAMNAGITVPLILNVGYHFG